MYNEIKQNILKNFFHKNYRGTLCTVKSIIYEDITKRSMFDCDWSDDSNTCVMHIGDGIDITFNLHWEMRNQKNNLALYRLSEID